MEYRKLGKTGLKVSQIGFGAMRLPMTGEEEDRVVDRELAIPMIHRAFEAGVNYIDTAVGYCNSDSERAVGEALKGWREKIVVSTKNHYYGESEKEWWQLLENSLTRLDKESIDIYNHHGITWKKYVEDVEPRVGAWMRKAYDQGLIKHICFSFHDTNENLIKLIDTGYAESITLQYNILDQSLEEGITYAGERNTGIVVMGPVGGGRLGIRSEVFEQLIPGVERVPELALRFVLANPHVTMALSGMSTMEHVEENIRTASDGRGLTEEHMRMIHEHLGRMKEMATGYCTGCGYCLPCPHEVAIAKIFERYALGQVYGLWEHARKSYERIGTVSWDKGARADACVECGQCEEKCPQKIPIIKQLKEAHEKLTSKD